MGDLEGREVVWGMELEGMNKHIIERTLVAVFLLISLTHAGFGKWGPAGYFLFLAAFVDFEDWSTDRRDR